MNKNGVYAALVLFLLGTATLVAQSADSEHVSQLLATAKTQATNASQDADLLKTYTRSSLALASHGDQIEKIRGHVNDLGRTASELTAARSEASPWQQQAIDRIDPLLRELAETVTTTINHMNDHPDRIHMQPYRDYVSATYDVANRTATAISDFVEYGKTKARMQQLEQKLEVTPAAAGN